MIETVTGIIVFIFGIMIGSFLNVVIYRIPNGESIVFPASKLIRISTRPDKAIDDSVQLQLKIVKTGYKTVEKVKEINYGGIQDNIINVILEPNQ